MLSEEIDWKLLILLNVKPHLLIWLENVKVQFFLGSFVLKFM